MNASELNNLAGVAIAVGGPIVARWGIDSATWSGIVASSIPFVTAAAGGAWLIYSHWNMKKVPEKATVVATGK